MLKKISIRGRITLYSALLSTVCCILLTCVLNISAFHMADSIGAAQMAPAQSIYEEKSLDMLPIIASEEVQTAKWAFGNQSLLYMLLIITGGSALTYYVTGKALRPLQALNIQVKNMTVSHLSESLSVTDAKDEIAELTNSFNEMTDKLNDAFLAQQRFSANAAHELRTPLAVLQTKVDVFKKIPVHTTEEYEALIIVFENQIIRLRNLVKTLLEMTNMDEIGEPVSIPLDAMLEDIISDLTPVASARHITLHLSCQNYTVQGNPDLLYRAFYNLIENGIKYNQEYGKVWIEVCQTSTKNIQISIQDTGIGIPDTLKKHIFEPFFRVDKSRSRSMGGAGLGLAMTKQIIEKHNGTIAVSDNQNMGTCFQVTL